MRLSRKEDLSLYYYIKDIVLRDFIEKEEDIPLILIPELSSPTSFVYEALTEMVPSPVDRGRGWRYFDDIDLDTCLVNTATFSGTPQQTNSVIVYDGVGNVISGTDYMIDYIDGRVVTSGSVEPAAVDYYWNYISVVDEWAAIEAANPPVVVLDVHGVDKAGFQLGSGRKTTRKVDIHIFATGTSERNDIVETIYDGLYNKGVPLYDFPYGTVLDYDGTFQGSKDNVNKLTLLFDRSTVLGYSRLQFENVSARHVNLPLIMSRGVNEVLLSDLNAYRSKISFDMVSYVDV